MRHETGIKFTNICNEHGWRLIVDGRDEFTVEKWSPAGEDWPISLSGSTLCEVAADLDQYIQNYDPEEHASEILVAKRSGSEDARRFYAAAPDSLRELLDDAECMKRECEELRDALYKGARSRAR